MLRHLRIVLVALFAIFGATQALASQSAGASAKDVVVTVGGKPIKQSQIDTVVDLMAKAQSENGEVTDDQKEQMKKLVATNLIGQELLELEAQSQHIVATQAEVDSLLRVFKARFPDEAAFEKTLKEAGDTQAKMKAKLAKQIRADKVLAQHIRKPDMPTDAEMQAFWQEHQKEFPVNDSLRALQIVLLADDKTPVEVANKKRDALESIREDLLRDSGQATGLLLQRFMATAAQVSEGPEAKTGGDLQRFDPRDFNPEFQKQVEALRVGQLSPVFQSPLGFHLLLLIEKYDGKYDSYKLQIIQNIVNQKTRVVGGEMREYLRSLAVKFPVKYKDPDYQDSSESGIY